MQGDRRQGHRRGGRRPARPSWPARCSASTTSRPAARPRLMLVAPNLVQVERELGVDPARLPALGLHARGDPPGAVHRRALAARPHGRPRSAPWPPTSCRTPSRSRRPSQRLGRQLPEALQGGGAGPDRADRHARAARRARRGHRRHVPARGPRRRRHGRGRARRSSRRSPRSATRFDQRRKGVGALRPAAAPPARPRGQDAPVPRRRGLRPRRRRRGRASTASTASGSRPRPCRLPAEIDDPVGLGRPRPRLTGRRS